MTGYQLFIIIFSIVLLPTNVLCAFRLFREALDLTGMTFSEFVEKNYPKALHINSGVRRIRNRRLRRFLTEFFGAHSSDPQRSLRLTWTFGYCTIPGAFALALAAFAAVCPSRLVYVFAGDVALLLVNVAIAAGGAVYGRQHPRHGASSQRLARGECGSYDEYTAQGEDVTQSKHSLQTEYTAKGDRRTRSGQNAKVKRTARGGNSHTKQRTQRGRIGALGLKSIIVYALVCVLFFGFLLFFMLGMAGVARTYRAPTSGTPTAPTADTPTAIELRAELIPLLNSYGYETANVQTTYWRLDEAKLEHVAAGVKGGSKLELYGYSDGETVDLVYNQIVCQTAPELEASEREAHESELHGVKLFTYRTDEAWYLVAYRGETVVYACAPDSLDEINEILYAAGYFRG